MKQRVNRKNISSFYEAQIGWVCWDAYYLLGENLNEVGPNIAQMENMNNICSV